MGCAAAGNIEKQHRFFQHNPAYGKLLFGNATPGPDMVKRATVSLLSTQLAERWRAGHDGFHDGDVDDVSRMASRLFTFVEQSNFEQNGDRQNAVSVVEAVKALQADLPIYLRPRPKGPDPLRTTLSWRQSSF